MLLIAALKRNRSTVLPEPLLQVLALDDAEDQHQAISVRNLVQDSIVADAHSQEVVPESLDSFHKLAPGGSIPGQSVDC